MKLIIPALVAVAALTLSCARDSSGNRQAVAGAEDCRPAIVVRLDLAADSLAAGGDPYLARTHAFSQWMEMSGVSEGYDPVEFASSRRISAFLPDVAKRFPSADSIADPLGRVLSALSVRRTVYTIVSPFLQSVVLSGDTAVYVALNHYLGAGHAAYEGFPDYLRRLKTPGRMPLDVAEALLASMNPFAAAEPSTVLSRMLYDGALLEMVMEASGVDECEALGWTRQQMQWAEANEGRVWDELLRRKLLFSTDPVVADRLLAPAPSTSLINPDSPGRLGRFIGHRIVRSWLRANGGDAVGARLLDPSFYAAPETLARASYSPR